MRQFQIICYIWACVCAICMHIFAYEHVYTSQISAMRCKVSRAPQARAKKILRIPYIIRFLYFALVLQSHNKYSSHLDTVNVGSLKNLKYFTLNATFSRTPLSKRAMCVFNPVRLHANKTNVHTRNNSKVYIKRRHCTKRTGSRTLTF